MEDSSYSIHTGQKNQFDVVDFIVFGFFLSVSLFIGFYYAYKDRQVQDPSEILLAGGNMGVLPVSLSLTVTFMSALTLIGLPAEIYVNGTMFWWMCLSMVLAVAGAAHIFNPLFYRMKITSVYKYLDLRYGKVMEVVASLTWFVETLTYLALVLYAPALALKSVTGMELWVSIITVGGLVTTYTSIGGLKAVLWTDSFQALVILVGLLAVLIQGCIVVGGFSNAWEIAHKKSRIVLDDFSADPTTRHSVWSFLIGGSLHWMSFYAVNQCQVQRLLSLPTLRKAKIALWLNAVGLVSIVTLCCMIGVVLFAFYSDCHPLHFGLITNTDELLPLLVMDILGHLKGLPGLFLSCVFSGSLSTLSSGINSMSAVALQDYIVPFCACEISDFKATVLTRLLAAGFGLLTIGLAFVASKLGSILQLSYVVLSVLDGPLFGSFILGVFFPRANAAGAVTGHILSLALLFWIGIGAFFHPVPTPGIIYSTIDCNWNITNTTAPTLTENITVLPQETDSLGIYSLSYLYYPFVGILANVVIGFIVSLITGYGKPVTTDAKLIYPIVDLLCPCMPKNLKRKWQYSDGKSETEKTEATDSSELEKLA